jgi:hypothetical protein
MVASAWPEIVPASPDADFITGQTINVDGRKKHALKRLPPGKTEGSTFKQRESNQHDKRKPV